MRSLFVTVFSLTMAAFVPPALAQPAGDTARQPTESAPHHAAAADQKFFTRAHDDNRMQVELGKLAKEKGENELVRDLGQRMVDDHTRAQGELERIGDEQGLAAPAENEPTQDPAYKALSQLSGQAFDDAYIQHMEKEHTETIATFQGEARHGTNPELRHYAERQLPMLRAHEETARVVHRQSKAPAGHPSSHAQPNQAQPNQAQPNQAQPNQAQPNQAQPGTAP